MKINIAVNTMKAVFEEMDKGFTIWEYREEIKELLKCGVFVSHIDRHLEPHQHVICEICGRSINQNALAYIADAIKKGGLL